MILIPQTDWELRNTEKKGRGIFATKDILPGTIIGDYLGVIMPDSEISEEVHGLYDMHFSDTTAIVADPKEIGVHIINNSCAPNCDTYTYKSHVLFFALRHIFAGEELSISYYLEPPEKGHICNHPCFCNTPVCRGTMHVSEEVTRQIHAFILKEEEKFPSEIEIPVGGRLTALSEYPAFIEDDEFYDLFGDFQQESVAQEDSELPTILEIRKRIRESGRRLLFNKLRLEVDGFMNHLLIAKRI